MNETKDTTAPTPGEAQADKFVLRLYVAGNSPQSVRAVERARTFCETYIKGAYELSVIDLYQEPERADADRIIAVPTLVKQLPPPLRQLIGDLSDTSRLFITLDIEPKET